MWTEKTVAEATKGKVSGKWNAHGVGIDSRNVRRGDLFVAIKGERFDGHDYVSEALAKGAAAVMVSRQVDGPCVVVADTMKALNDLAAYNRARSKAMLVGVTGSIGKTGTKEALRLALASAGKVFANEGNLNNHIGVPLSLANLPTDAQFGIFEMGMNHAGEIAPLSKLVQPQVAVITNVEAVHLEFFDSVEGIADAKAEIMEGMPKGATVVLNRDNKYFERLVMQAQGYGLNVKSFGAHEKCDYRLMRYSVRDMGSDVLADIGGTAVTYRLGTVGKHWALASLSVLAAAVAAGCDLARAAAALAAFSEPAGRGKLYRLTDGTILIDDCYNASPVSVAGALSKQAELFASVGGKGRMIAVLGDMLELGERAAEFHAALAEEIVRQRIHKVYCCGPLMKHLFDALPTSAKGAHAKDAAALLPIVQDTITAADIVLIKGSNGSRMRVIRDALLESVSPQKETAHAL